MVGRITKKFTSSSRASRGGSFRRKKNYIQQRKNLPVECAQGDRPARCPNHFFAVKEPSAAPWWWCDLFWCHEVACRVRWSNVDGCEVTWGALLRLVATWHVMPCHLMWWSRHLMRSDCLCCVMSRDAMRCHGDELLSVVPCTGMECYELKMPLVVWFEVVLWPCHDPKYYTLYYKVLLQYDSVLQSITLYSSVLLQYYSVLQSTTTYSSNTTPHYKDKVLLYTTKYYSSTTLYYKVLLQYYPVLQTPYHSFERPTRTKWRRRAAPSANFSFYHSFERPTRTKWPKSHSDSLRNRVLPQFQRPTRTKWRKGDTEPAFGGCIWRKAACLSTLRPDEKAGIISQIHEAHNSRSI